MSIHVSKDEVAAVIGYTAFETLIEARGGTEMRIPASPTAQLIQWIGEGAAIALCSDFVGCKINLPNNRATPSLRSRIEPLINRGDMSENDIALAVGCTVKTVRKWRRILRETEPGSGLASEPSAK